MLRAPLDEPKTVESTSMPRAMRLSSPRGPPVAFRRMRAMTLKSSSALAMAEGSGSVEKATRVRPVLVERGNSASRFTARPLRTTVSSGPSPPTLALLDPSLFWVPTCPTTERTVGGLASLRLLRGVGRGDRLRLGDRMQNGEAEDEGESLVHNARG